MTLSEWLSDCCDRERQRPRLINRKRASLLGFDILKVITTIVVTMTIISSHYHSIHNMPSPPLLMLVSTTPSPLQSLSPPSSSNEISNHRRHRIGVNSTVHLLHPRCYVSPATTPTTCTTTPTSQPFAVSPPSPTASIPSLSLAECQRELVKQTGLVTPGSSIHFPFRLTLCLPVCPPAYVRRACHSMVWGIGASRYACSHGSIRPSGPMCGHGRHGS